MYHCEYRQSISSYSQWITADHAHEMPIVIGKFTKKIHLRMIFSFYWNFSVKFLLSFCCCFFVLAWGFVPLISFHLISSSLRNADVKDILEVIFWHWVILLSKYPNVLSGEPFLERFPDIWSDEDKRLSDNVIVTFIERFVHSFIF